MKMDIRSGRELVSKLRLEEIFDVIAVGIEPI